MDDVRTNRLINPIIHGMSPQKDKLLELEKSGDYVFHGSGESLKKLMPRQAYTYVEGQQLKDGEPAVFASSRIEYAVLMAIINRANCVGSYHSGAGVHIDEAGVMTLKLRASKETMANLKHDARGYVYVLNKKGFTNRHPKGVEYVAHGEVTPVEIIVVSREDLSRDIEIFEE
jgi:hypothetical protein